MYDERVVERFWSKVDRGDGDACWPWTAGFFQRTGYGQFHPIRTRAVGAHRMAWEIVNGPIPEGMFVLHSCDNPPCCNPAHLSVGTPSENTRDAMTKGRLARGERHGSARLTEADVRAIRRRAAAGQIARVIADDYGMSRRAVASIIEGRAWRHVDA